MEIGNWKFEIRDWKIEIGIWNCSGIEIELMVDEFFKDIYEQKQVEKSITTAAPL